MADCARRLFLKTLLLGALVYAGYFLSEVSAKNADNLFGYTPTDCKRFLEIFQRRAEELGTRGLRELDDRQKEFVERVLVPQLGRRVLQDYVLNSRKLGNENGRLTFGSMIDYPQLQVDWVKGIKKPEILYLENEKYLWSRDASGKPKFRTGKVNRLLIPDSMSIDDFINDKPKKWIRLLAMGHPFHPFMTNEASVKGRSALHEPRFLAREVQAEAMEVGDLARERGDRKLLIVAPTGVGKTAVLLHRLVDEIQNEDLTKRGLKLKFVLADQNGHVEQLYDDIRALNPKTRRKKKMDVEGSKRKVELETIYISHEDVARMYGEGRDGSEKGKAITKSDAPLSAEDNSAEKHSTRFELMVWGEGMGRKTSIEDLYNLTIKSEAPIVVATTIQTLKRKIGKEPISRELRLVLIREILSTILWDEVHHAGAEEAMELLRDLVDHRDSKAHLEGVTATPVHRKTDMFKAFDKKVFRMYLDTIDEYMNGTEDRTIDIEEILDQLGTAIENGELVEPQFTYFDPHKILPNGESIFIKASGTESRRKKKGVSSLLGRRYHDSQGGGSGSRYVINPKYYGEVAAHIMKFLTRNEYGLITARDVDEVNAITEFLNKLFERNLADGKIRPDQMRTFQALHSDMSTAAKKQIRKDAREKKFNFLVTRFMGDEALNFPHFTAYIDLNRSIGPRQVLQRIGRVLRLHVLKTAADVVSFVLINESAVAENLRALHRINKGDLNKTGAIRSEVTDDTPKELSLPDGTTVQVNNFTNDDRVNLNLAIEAQLQTFWIAKEDLAAQLDYFLREHKRLPSTNAFLADEKSLALKVRSFLKKDFHEEFWSLLEPSTKKTLIDSELDFRPIKDVVSELRRLADDLDEAGETEVDWPETARTQRIRNAIQRAYRKNPHFMDKLDPEDLENQTFLRDLAISALPKADQIRIRLIDFWNLTKSLPDPFRKLSREDDEIAHEIESASKEAQLASDLRKLTMKNGKLNFISSLPAEIQAAIHASPYDYVPHRPVFDRLRNYLRVQFANRSMKDSADIYSYQWDFAPAAREFRDFIRKAYLNDPTIVESLRQKGIESHPAFAEVNLFISALYDEDRAAERLKLFLHSQQLSSEPRGGAEGQVLEEVHEALKGNPNWIRRLDPTLAKIIQTHPYFEDLMDHHTGIAVTTASIDVKWPISQEPETEFLKRFVTFLLTEDRPPGTNKVGRKFNVLKRDFNHLEIQMIARMARILDAQTVEAVRKKLFQQVDLGSRSYLQMQLSTSAFLETTKAKEWTFFNAMRVVNKYIREHGTIPPSKTSDKAGVEAYNQMKIWLTNYPQLIDYFNTEAQIQIRASDLWKVIVSVLPIK